MPCDSDVDDEGYVPPVDDEDDDVAEGSAKILDQPTMAPARKRKINDIWDTINPVSDLKPEAALAPKVPKKILKKSLKLNRF